MISIEVNDELEEWGEYIGYAIMCEERDMIRWAYEYTDSWKDHHSLLKIIKLSVASE